MANNILTNLVITREAARVLHQQGNFLGSVNREYRDEFAKSGAKAGDTINMRLPSKYTVRTNATFAGQDHFERSTPLAVLSQYGVDVSFTTKDRTLSLDDYSNRVLKPATYRSFQKMGQRITDELAPNGDRTALLQPASVVEFLDVTKGLFAAQSNLNEQFREGIMGRTGGLDVGENTLLPNHVTGTMAGSPVTFGTTLGLSTTANSWTSTTTLSVTGATGTGTLKAGDIITLSGAFAAHAESKANTGRLQQFVVQADVTMTTATSTYSVTVKPALLWGSGNAFQNVTLSGVSDTSALTITRLGASATTFSQDIAFHKDAFAFASVDLEDMSPYGAACTRATSDNISIRFIQQYDASADTVRGRFDVLWGFAPLLPELAVRHLTTQSLLNT